MTRHCKLKPLESAFFLLFFLKFPSKERTYSNEGAYLVWSYFLVVATFIPQLFGCTQSNFIKCCKFLEQNMSKLTLLN